VVNIGSGGHVDTFISVEITAKDAKDAKDLIATACATLCDPDAVGARNTDETLHPLCSLIIVEIHLGFP